MINGINLIPEEVMRGYRVKRLRAALVFVSIIYLILLGTLYLYQRSMVWAEEADFTELQRTKKALVARSAEHSELKRMIQETQAITSELQKRVNLAAGIEKKGISWSSVLKRLSREIPGKVWLRSISTSDSPESGSKKMRFIGSATSNRAVADFVFSLENSSIFTDVTLAYSQKKDFQSTVVYDFEVHANLRVTTEIMYE